MKKARITRKEAREKLDSIYLSGELVKVVKRFFPGLVDLLRQVHDPRNQSYITYQQEVLLVTRILSAVFYIESMRKASAELNFSMAIENVGTLCGQKLEELPYWETINQYLERVNPQDLQNIINKIIWRLLRSRAFEQARIKGEYWQVIIDGTRLYTSYEPLDGHYLFKVHNKGTADEHTEYYYYVLEAKIVLHSEICVSIMTEFVENIDEETNKQDCELKACWRLMERLKRAFPRLPICISADSLYACEPFFRVCGENKWKFLLRFKEGSIPSVYQEYVSLKLFQGNRQEEKTAKKTVWHDYVTGVCYKGFFVNLIEYGESDKPYPFYFLTDISVSKSNVKSMTIFGRLRWSIENRGFNAQKKHGFNLEHLYSKDYNAMKCHYFLIQIGHMIAQIMDAWKSLWKGIRLSLEQKHRRLLESWKTHPIREIMEQDTQKYQIRFNE